MMTLKELSRLYHLTREIELDQKRLDALRSLAESPARARLTGMPFNSKAFDRSAVEEYATEIADICRDIRNKRRRCIRERKRLAAYIDGIPCGLTKQIFTLRFIEGLGWDEVAERLGGRNNAKRVSKICYRFLRNHEKQT